MEKEEKMKLLEQCLKYKKTADDISIFLDVINHTIKPVIWLSLDPNPDNPGFLKFDENMHNRLITLLTDIQKEYEELFDTYDIIKRNKQND